MTHHRINAFWAWFLGFSFAIGGASLLGAGLIALLGEIPIGSPVWWLFFSPFPAIGVWFIRGIENAIRKLAFGLPDVEETIGLDDGDRISNEAEDALAQRLKDELKR